MFLNCDSLIQGWKDENIQQTLKVMASVSKTSHKMVEVSAVAVGDERFIADL